MWWIWCYAGRFGAVFVQIWVLVWAACVLVQFVGGLVGFDVWLEMVFGGI